MYVYADGTRNLVDPGAEELPAIDMHISSIHIADTYTHKYIHTHE